MKIKKVVLTLLKLIGLAGAVVVVANVVMAVREVLNVKSREFDEEVVSVFGEKAFDMAEQPHSVDAVSKFSSTTFDYRNANESEEPYILNIEAGYSRVEILVPDGWFVESKGRIAMAGMDNMTLTYEEQEPQLIVTVNAKFAGIQIHNLE